MPFNIGPLELLIVLILALIILGPGKLPEVGAALGKTIREFRKASSDVEDAIRADPAASSAPTTTVTPIASAAPPAPAPFAAPAAPVASGQPASEPAPAAAPAVTETTHPEDRAAS